MLGEQTCHFCGVEATDGQTWVTLRVEYFDRSFRLCAACADDYNQGGHALAPFVPHYDPQPVVVWPGPMGQDAVPLVREIRAARGLEVDGLELSAAAHDAWRKDPGSELDFAEALGWSIESGEPLAPVADLERAEREIRRSAKTQAVGLLLGLYAHAMLRKDPSGEHAKLLDLASFAYLAHLGYSLRTERDGRIAAMVVDLRRLADKPDEAADRLRHFLGEAQRVEPARDPRLAMQQALLDQARGNLRGATKHFALAREWLAQKADRSQWTEVEATLHRNAASRALQARDWTVARDVLRSYLAIAPDDRAARYDLGYVYVALSMDPVAREVLQDALDDTVRDHLAALAEEASPQDERGLLLLATCLVRLDEVGAAFDLLARDLDESTDAGTLEFLRVRVERLHLAALCAHRAGEPERARRWLGRAYRLTRSEGVRDRSVLDPLVTLLFEHAVALLRASASSKELAREYATWRDVTDDVYPKAHRAMIELFFAAEVESGFRGSSHFGFDQTLSAVGVAADDDLFMAYRCLALRQLPQAVQHDRRARARGVRGVPMRVLLGFLQTLRNERV